MFTFNLRRDRTARSAPPLVARLGGSLVGLAALLLVPGVARAQTVPPTSLQAVSPFTVTGFIQKATVDNPSDTFSGGTVMVNDLLITVPRNTLFQFPATSMTWQEMFKLAPAPWGPTQSGLALGDSPTPAATYEVTILGNRVGRSARRRHVHRRAHLPVAAIAECRPGVHQLHRLRHRRAVDTLTITAATWTSKKSRLTVTVRDSVTNGKPVLTLHIPGQPDVTMVFDPATLTYVAGIPPAGTLTVNPAPSSISITSSFGGSASAPVQVK